MFSFLTFTNESISLKKINQFAAFSFHFSSSRWITSTQRFRLKMLFFFFVSCEIAKWQDHQTVSPQMNNDVWTWTWLSKKNEFLLHRLSRKHRKIVIWWCSTLFFIIYFGTRKISRLLLLLLYINLICNSTYVKTSKNFIDLISIICEAIYHSSNFEVNVFFLLIWKRPSNIRNIFRNHFEMVLLVDIVTNFSINSLLNAI